MQKSSSLFLAGIHVLGALLMYLVCPLEAVTPKAAAPKAATPKATPSTAGGAPPTEGGDMSDVVENPYAIPEASRQNALDALKQGKGYGSPGYEGGVEPVRTYTTNPYGVATQSDQEIAAQQAMGMPFGM